MFNNDYYEELLRYGASPQLAMFVADSAISFEAAQLINTTLNATQLLFASPSATEV